jgi:hypothetical protein
VSEDIISIKEWCDFEIKRQSKAFFDFMFWNVWLPKVVVVIILLVVLILWWLK